MNRTCVFALLLLVAVGHARAQWELQDSHSTASFRGIHSVHGKVAWASGTEGTVLRTEDGGSHWEKCAVPAGAEKLDFRGVWAWDAKKAIVMSAGPGELSRIYRTTDGGQNWTEEIRNTDKEGFWDAIAFQAGDAAGKTGGLVGDPIGGRFDTRVMTANGWAKADDSCTAKTGEAAFAASDSSVVVFGARRYMIGSGGKGGPRILFSPSFASREGRKECREVSVPL